MLVNYRKAAAAAGSVLAVIVIAATIYVLHGPARPQPASHHTAAGHQAAAAIPAASQGAAALPSPSQLSSPAAAHAQAPKTPAAPAATPAAPASPAGPDPLTACPQLGATTTDGAGNLVRCEGNISAPEWVCDPGYPYPAAYPPVLGQPAGDAGTQPVVDTARTAYVAPIGGAWEVVSPPC